MWRHTTTQLEENKRLEHSALSGMSISHTSLQGSGIYVKEWVGRWLQGNIVIQTQQGRCIYKLTKSVTALWRPTQVQARQSPTMEERWGTTSHPYLRHYCIWLTLDGGKVTFLSMEWYLVYQSNSMAGINHSLLSQHKPVHGIVLSFSTQLERKKTWSWVERDSVGGLGRNWRRAKIWSEYITWNSQRIKKP